MCDISKQEPMGDLRGDPGRTPWQSCNESWWSEGTKADTSGLQGSGTAADVWRSATCEQEKSRLNTIHLMCLQIGKSILYQYPSIFTTFQSKGSREPELGSHIRTKTNAQTVNKINWRERRKNDVCGCDAMLLSIKNNLENSNMWEVNQCESTLHTNIRYNQSDRRALCISNMRGSTEISVVLLKRR